MSIVHDGGCLRPFMQALCILQQSPQNHYKRVTMPACILVALCGAPFQLALDPCPLHVKSCSYKALPRAVDALPLTMAWTVPSSLPGQSSIDSTRHWLISSIPFWMLPWFLFKVGTSRQLRLRGLSLGG